MTQQIQPSVPGRVTSQSIIPHQETRISGSRRYIDALERHLHEQGRLVRVMRRDLKRGSQEAVVIFTGTAPIFPRYLDRQEQQRQKPVVERWWFPIVLILAMIAILVLLGMLAFAQASSKFGDEGAVGLMVAVPLAFGAGWAWLKRSKTTGGSKRGADGKKMGYHLSPCDD